MSNKLCFRFVRTAFIFVIVRFGKHVSVNCVGFKNRFEDYEFIYVPYTIQLFKTFI